MGVNENNGNYANWVRENSANVSMKGLEAVFYVKEKGVEELKEYEGIITNVRLGGFIEFKDRDGEDAHVPFCGAYSGLYRVKDKALGRLVFENPNVLPAYRARVGEPHIIQSEEGRRELSSMGRFFLYCNTYSGTPDIRF